MSLYHWHFQTKMSRSLRLLRQETVTDCNYRQYHRMSNCIGSYNHIIVASTSSSSSAVVFTGATVFLKVNCSQPHWSHLSAGLSLTLIWSANRLMPLALCIYDGGAIEVDRSIEFVTYGRLRMISIKSAGFYRIKYSSQETCIWNAWHVPIFTYGGVRWTGLADVT